MRLSLQLLDVYHSRNTWRYRFEYLAQTIRGFNILTKSKSKNTLQWVLNIPSIVLLLTHVQATLLKIPVIRTPIWDSHRGAHMHSSVSYYTPLYPTHRSTARWSYLWLHLRTRNFYPASFCLFPLEFCIFITRASSCIRGTKWNIGILNTAADSKTISETFRDQKHTRDRWAEDVFNKMCEISRPPLNRS